MGLESSLDPVYGVYHASSQGSYAWYEFAAEILRQSGLAQNLAKTGDFGDRAARPAYSVLENRALQSIGLDQMRSWQERAGGLSARAPTGSRTERKSKT